MPRITADVRVHTSPADLFRFCHNVERRPDWDERIVHMELLSPPPLRTGTLVRVDVGEDGEFKFTWDGEYTTVQFPSRSQVRVLDAAMKSPFSTASETWTFEHCEEGTHFSLVWEYEPRGLPARVLDVLGRRARTERAIGRSLVQLKELVEAG
jgi:ribosome-associated toxin RatA of RatAB toxin-antitoxin module